MHVLNVGKADAILLECEGRFMLVDGGTVDQGVPIRQYLTRRGVQHLDYLVNTHPDDDHMGGLEAVVQQFSVNAFLTTELPDELQPQSASYASLLQTMEQRHVRHKTVAAGDTVSLGSAQVDVLGPITMADDTNNNSLVLKVTYGETAFLLMGDAEEEEEESLLKSGVDLSANVLKVGHHGSNQNRCKIFIRLRARFLLVCFILASIRIPWRKFMFLVPTRRRLSSGHCSSILIPKIRLSSLRR